MAERIVSLLASATEIICALGAGDRLVGRSHECDSPEWVKQLPQLSTPAFDVSVSSAAIDAEVRRRMQSGEPLYLVNNDQIAELRPELIVTQSHCEVCAVTPGDVMAKGPRQIAISAFSVSDILQAIGNISDALDCPDRGRQLVGQQLEGLESVCGQVAPSPARSLMILEWIDPLFASGNWIPELVEAANGRLLSGKKGEYSRAISANELCEANPEFVVIAPCGFDLMRTITESAELTRKPWWSALDAVRQGRVAVADGNRFFNRAGLTIVETAQILAEILHGMDYGHSARGHWQWLR